MHRQVTRYQAQGAEAEFEPDCEAGVRGAEKQRYIAAIHAALDRNHEPMKLVMRRVIERSLRSYAKVS
jgi:hypothetical protein